MIINILFDMWNLKRNGIFDYVLNDLVMKSMVLLTQKLDTIELKKNSCDIVS